MTTAAQPLSITVEAIVAGLDTLAYGQTAAKRTLAEAAVGLLYEVNRSNVVLAAPTGTGKTLLATSLGKVLEQLLERPVPTLVVDATALVPAGYKGLSLEERLEPYVGRHADQSLAGILVIDELDKLGSTGEARFRAQCEASLLTLLNGDALPVDRRHGPFGGSSDSNSFQSGRWLVIGTGAFSDVRARLHREAAGTGFRNSIRPPTPGAPAPTPTTMPLTLDDLRTHGGLMAETWGRFHAMAQLSPPTRADLVRVAQASPNLRALVAQATNRKVQIEFGASFFERAADRALANHDSGYRAVAGAMHRVCATLTNLLLPASRRGPARAAGRLILAGKDFQALEAGTWQLPQPLATPAAPAPGAAPA